MHVSHLNPLIELEVTVEYWISDSHTAAGRITVHHLGDEPHELFLRLFTVLQPDENGRVMGAANHAGVIVLEGATGDLAPVLFLSGGATVVQAAYPAVGVQQIFAPGVSRSWTWVLASESQQGTVVPKVQGINRGFLGFGNRTGQLGEWISHRYRNRRS